MVRHADDILEDLQSLPDLVESQTPQDAPAQPQLPPDLDDLQKKIWEALAERRMVDDLTEQLGMAVTDLTRQLMMLELRKVVRRLPGNWYERF